MSCLRSQTTRRQEADPGGIGQFLLREAGRDMVIAVGGPAGIVHSTDYGFVLCGEKRPGGGRHLKGVLLGCTVHSGMGTLSSTNGQLIGWVTDKYDREDECNMTTIASISDYKGVLQNLSNGFAAPYFWNPWAGGELRHGGERASPQGIYVTDCIADSPAYNAGESSRATSLPGSTAPRPTP